MAETRPGSSKYELLLRYTSGKLNATGFGRDAMGGGATIQCGDALSNSGTLRRAVRCPCEL
jgi:hypothetical protein